MLGLFRSKAFYVVVVAGLATIIMLGATRYERLAVTRAESWLSDALSPLQSASSWVVQRASGSFNAITELGRLREENQQLRAALAQQPGLQAQLTELRAENEQLRAQLGLVKRASLRYQSAEVIGRNSDNWFDTITINRGSRDGVVRDMAVVTEQGLVGRVFRVTDRTATVMLVTDRDSGVGVLVASSRDAGILRGQDEGSLAMRLFNPEAQVVAGDQILTSGLNSVYPKGIPVGTVTQVTGQGLIKEAVVQPAVDFYHLERVLVVVWAPADGMGLPPLPELTPPQPTEGEALPGSDQPAAPQPGQTAPQPDQPAPQPADGAEAGGGTGTGNGTGVTPPTAGETPAPQTPAQDGVTTP